MRRADINLGNDDHDGDVESHGNAEVLLAHADKAVVGCHHEETVVWAAGEHAEDGGTEVALMAREIGEGDDLGTAPANFLPSKLTTGGVGDDDVAAGVEAEDFHADGASAPRLNLVLVAEEIDSGAASAVV